MHGGIYETAGVLIATRYAMSGFIDGGQVLAHSQGIPKRRFQLILIKPSHYDDDGYVIRWWRAMIPSNSLAAMYGIAADSAEREALSPAAAPMSPT